MKLTKEQIKSLKSASSAEEISAKLGNFVTPEQAARIYSVVKGKEALSDEELADIAGGCGEKIEIPEKCPKCGGKMVYEDDLRQALCWFCCESCGHKIYV